MNAVSTLIIYATFGLAVTTWLTMERRLSSSWMIRLATLILWPIYLPVLLGTGPSQRQLVTSGSRRPGARTTHRIGRPGQAGHAGAGQAELKESACGPEGADPHPMPARGVRPGLAQTDFDAPLEGLRALIERWPVEDAQKRHYRDAVSNLTSALARRIETIDQLEGVESRLVALKNRLDPRHDSQPVDEALTRVGTTLRRVEGEVVAANDAALRLLVRLELLDIEASGAGLEIALRDLEEETGRLLEAQAEVEIVLGLSGVMCHPQSSSTAQSGSAAPRRAPQK